MQSRLLSNQDVPVDNAALLRRALQSNALFSLLSALAFIFASGPVARFLGPAVPSWIILAIGVSFLPFVYGVYGVSSDIAGLHPGDERQRARYSGVSAAVAHPPDEIGRAHV